MRSVSVNQLRLKRQNGKWRVERQCKAGTGSEREITVVQSLRTFSNTLKFRTFSLNGSYVKSTGRGIGLICVSIITLNIYYVQDTHYVPFHFHYVPASF